MNLGSRFRGFSLIEVILAVALFAGSVAVILGLVTGLSRQAAESAEVLVAQRFPDAVAAELTRCAAVGFDQLAGQIPVMMGPLDQGFSLVADRDGVGLHAMDSPSPGAGIPVSDRFFLVECWRFPDGPLRFDANKAFLALHVRVSWPYRVPGMAMPVPLAERNHLGFTVTLNR